MPFRQLKSFLKILIGVQYENPPIGTARPDSRNNLYPRGHDVKALNFAHHIMILQETQRRIYPLKHFCTHPQIKRPSHNTARQGFDSRRAVSLVFQYIPAICPKHTDKIVSSVRRRKSPRALSVFHNVRHQPQIPFYENIPRFQISLPRQIQIVPFLFLRQRAGKAARGQLQ